VKEETPIELLKQDLVTLILKYAQEDLLDFNLWPVEETVKMASVEVTHSSKEVVKLIQEIQTEMGLINFIRRMIVLFDEYPKRQDELADLIFDYEFRVQWL
tara:strand:+ start:1341 stop:1643 length:303 start_codon:yes stop_codon:yes gene_type:complete